MVQRHSIVLWRKAEKKAKEFEELAKETYEIMTIFQSYPIEIRPNYLAEKLKNDTNKFEWNYENFKDVLKKGVNKENEREFKDLGYSLSFFSSMSEHNSCSFEITVGNKNERFYNTIIINLPVSLNYFEIRTTDMIRELFGKLVQVYRPYWGCVSNKILSRKYGKFLDGDLPTTVHWMNYWSENIISKIGEDKIQKIVDENSMLTFEEGRLFIKDTAFDIENYEDVSYHEFLHKQFFA
ncbi:MAG: hypothetical protein IJO70_05270 [Lachnospiraceae bacterium]|nr:hypothetical protein [Lachnospiraceae bacterium]